MGKIQQDSEYDVPEDFDTEVRFAHKVINDIADSIEDGKTRKVALHGPSYFLEVTIAVKFRKDGDMENENL